MFRFSSFVRNVVAIASGTAIAQAIVIVASPIVTRLFGPDAFGQLGVFNSVVNLLAAGAALAFPLAIVLPRDKDVAIRLTYLSALSALSFTFCSALILMRFEGPLLTRVGLDVGIGFVYLVPLAVFLSVVQQIGQQWLVRLRAFSRVGQVNAIQASLTQGANVGIGAAYGTAPVLIWISTLGRLAHVLLLSFAAMEVGLFRSFRVYIRHKPLLLWQTARRFAEFPKYRAPQELLTGVSHTVPVLLLMSVFGPAVAGYFTLCRSILSMPTQLLGSSVASVFYPRITEAARKGDDIRKLILRATALLAATAIAPFLAIVVAGPSIFEFVFGGDWRVAGDYARWISVLSFSALLNRPAAQALPVLSLQGHNLALSVITVLLQFVALWVGFWFFGKAIYSVAFYAGVTVCANIVLIGGVLRVSGRWSGEGKFNNY